MSMITHLSDLEKMLWLGLRGKLLGGDAPGLHSEAIPASSDGPIAVVCGVLGAERAPALPKLPEDLQSEIIYLVWY